MPKQDVNLFLSAFQAMSTTRYVEYSHIHIKSVLQNLNTLLKVLPELIQSKEFDLGTQNKMKEAVEIMGNPVFVVNLIFADNVFIHISKMEKEAQSKTFFPFDFVKVRAELKKALSCKLKHPDHRAMKLLDTLVFEYEHTYKCKKHSFTVDCDKVWEELTFVDWKKLSGSECLQVKNAYRN